MLVTLGSDLKDCWPYWLWSRLVSAQIVGLLHAFIFHPCQFKGMLFLMYINVLYACGVRRICLVLSTPC